MSSKCTNNSFHQFVIKHGAEPIGPARRRRMTTIKRFARVLKDLELVANAVAKGGNAHVALADKTAAYRLHKVIRAAHRKLRPEVFAVEDAIAKAEGGAR